jgi:hypothetical protein
VFLISGFTGDTTDGSFLRYPWLDNWYCRELIAEKRFDMSEIELILEFSLDSTYWEELFYTSSSQLNSPGITDSISKILNMASLFKDLCLRFLASMAI